MWRLESLKTSSNAYSECYEAGESYTPFNLLTVQFECGFFVKTEIEFLSNLVLTNLVQLESSRFGPLFVLVMITLHSPM